MRYIKSPGVQITEKDFSLRVDLPVGTIIYVPGFAAQGPTEEPIQISTMSEFEAIFGIPTTPAERYFYNSCKEILNSPGQLIAARLPYGSDQGSASTSSMYSGLFYPMTSGYNPTTKVDEWVIGAPEYRPLSKDEYDSLLAGSVTWAGTSQYSSYKYVEVDTNGRPVLDVDGNIVYSSSPTSSSKRVVDAIGSVSTSNIDYGGSIIAGFYILNDLQTIINEVSEGFYVGLADNLSVALDSPNYDSVKSLLTINKNLAGATYFPIPTSRLDFALSATQLESMNGITSVSETLEKVGFSGFATRYYQDHISLGVFKIRQSTVDTNKLSLGFSERYLGSFDSARKQPNTSGGVPVNAFIENIVSETSPTIKMVINPAISRNFDWTFGSTTPEVRVTVSEEAKKLFPLGVYLPDTRNVEQTKIIGNLPLKLERALRFVDSPENLDLDLVVDGGLSTIFASTYTVATTGNVGYDDTLWSNGIDDIYKESWLSVILPLVNFCENTRKDCMAILDLPRQVFVNGMDAKILSLRDTNFTVDILKPSQQLVGGLDSNYSAIYGNWIKVNDIYSSKRYWHPPSGHVAAIYARSDAVSEMWSAPAGLNRGKFAAIDIAFNPNQKQKDAFYEAGINPIVFFNGDGHVVMGQKTLQTMPSAFDRVNVRRLFLALERKTQRALRYFVFEPNTTITRTRLVNTIAPLFDYAKANQGVYDYLIVCDERNNTPDSIDRNELIVDIYLKPVRTAEFILVNFIATRTGQSFSELM
jgi:hypothetical protein